MDIHIIIILSCLFACCYCDLGNQYLGCYKDAENDRAMTWVGYANTIEECLTICRKQGLFIGAMQQGTQCYCSSSSDGYRGHGASMNCYNDQAVRCPGNIHQICGGDNALSVYAVCPTGKFGSDCFEACDCGEHRICNANGDCTGACYSGYSNPVRGCTYPCSSGTFGPHCVESCPSGCANNRCDPQTGICTEGCISESRKGPYCLEQDCLTGTFGPDCQNECLNCDSNQCSHIDGNCWHGCKTRWTGSKCTECADGFYGSFCNQTCSENCQNNGCASDGSCSGCRDGWYGPSCIHGCPLNCQNNVCSLDGACPGCKEGWYDSKCTEPCPDGCAGECDLQNGICDSCKPGIYGRRCELTCDNCRDRDCDRDGACQSGCKDGHYGLACDSLCSMHCEQDSCAQNNGHCVHGCSDSALYGSTCDQPCPLDCPTPKCDRDGSCKPPCLTDDCLQCIDGYFGKQCQQTCTEKCFEKLCNSDGLCMKGCESGYYGIQCEQICSPPCPYESCDQETGQCISVAGSDASHNGNHSIPIAIGVVVPTVIIVIIIIIIAMIKKRRKNSTNNRDTDTEMEEHHYENTSPTDAVYQEIETNENLQSGSLLSVKDIGLYIHKMLARDFQTEYKALPINKQGKWTYVENMDVTTKNRSPNIIPYDHNRVMLDNDIGFAGYINASYLKGSGTQEYIAAQGPTERTLIDFFAMVCEKKIKTIVMLTAVVENNTPKCAQYWPDSREGHSQIGHFTINLLKQAQCVHYIIRRLQIKDGNGIYHMVLQFHYLTWPDHSITDSAVPLLSFRAKVQQASKDSTAPILVHGSLGVGRTGTFIALDMLLKQAEADGYVNVPATVRKLREDRINMVENQDQYEFLYKALHQGVQLGTDVFGVNPSSEYKQCDTHFKAMTNLHHETHGNLQTKHQVVLLNPVTGINEHMDAVLVDTFTKRDAYIVTHMPLSDTIVDFWTMVLDYKCTAIVALASSSEYENIHWLPTASSKVRLPSHEIWCEDSTTVHIATMSGDALDIQYNDNDYTRLQLSPVKPRQSIPVLHIPVSSAADIMNGYNKINTLQDNGIVVVLCQDGASESGVFVAGCCVLQMAEMGEGVSVVEAVQLIRESRPQFVNDVEQFKLLHNLIL